MTQIKSEDSPTCERRTGVAVMRHYRILSIEAWRYDEGWTWNQAFEVGTYDMDEEPADDNWPVELLLERGMITDGDLVQVVEYGEMNYEVQARDTDEPLFAFEEVPSW